MRRSLVVLLFTSASASAIGCGGSSSADLPSASPPAPPPPAPSSPTPPVADGPEILATDAGRIRGVVADGMRVWRGIPYAAPPVGDRRWREPAPVAPWSDERDGTRFGAECVQTAPDSSAAMGGSRIA